MVNNYHYTSKFPLTCRLLAIYSTVVYAMLLCVVQVLSYWPFGVVVCRAWLAIDVWLCTASIFNLCAISLDRYLAISRPIKYPTVMSPFRARLLIVTVWILSFVICFPPLIGNWNDGKQERPLATTTTPHYDVIGDVILLEDAAFLAGINYSDGYSHASAVNDDDVISSSLKSPNCALTSDPGYIVYSACGSFWVPMLGMVIFYGKIYKTAVSATQAVKRGFLEKKMNSGGNGLVNSTSDNELCTLRIHRGGSTAAGSMVRHSNGCISELLPRPSADVLMLQRSGSSAGRRSVDSRLPTMRSADNRLRAGEVDELKGREKDSARTMATRPDVTAQPLPMIVITASGSCAEDVNAERRRSQKSGEKRREQGNERKSDESVGNEAENSRKHGKFRSRKKTKNKNCKLAANDEADKNDVSKNAGKKRKSSFSGLLDADNAVTSSSNGDQTAAGGKRSSIQLVAARFAKLHIISQLRSLNKEKRAAKTVGIIVGCFIICWAPFFTVYLAGAFCPDCTPATVFHVFFWLGYCNSAANPFIYGLCSRDFRYAFKKFLRCQCLVRSARGGLVRQTNGQVMGLLQAMTMQIVARATADT